MGNETTAELPKLPECFKHPQVYGIGWILYTADQMNAHYLTGIEAGKASRAQSGWQPIETAPKDGTRVLAYREDWIDCYAVAWWSKGSGEWERSGSQFRQASHWMPLPATLGEMK